MGSAKIFLWDLWENYKYRPFWLTINHLNPNLPLAIFHIFSHFQRWTSSNSLVCRKLLNPTVSRWTVVQSKSHQRTIRQQSAWNSLPRRGFALTIPANQSSKFDGEMQSSRRTMTGKGKQTVSVSFTQSFQCFAPFLAYFSNRICW